MFTFTIICQQRRGLLLCFRLETSPFINPSGTNSILLFHKVYTKHQSANGWYYRASGTDRAQLLFYMNYAGDDIVNFNGCMRRYSPVQMKTGGKLFGWWKQGFSFAKRCLLNIRVIWDVTLFWLVNSYRRFERSCCLHFRGRVVALLRLLEPEDDGNKTFRNVGNYLQINKAKHPGRPRYSRRKYFGLLDLRERERVQKIHWSKTVFYCLRTGEAKILLHWEESSPFWWKHVTETLFSCRYRVFLFVITSILALILTKWTLSLIYGRILHSKAGTVNLLISTFHFVNW